VCLLADLTPFCFHLVTGLMFLHSLYCTLFLFCGNCAWYCIWIVLLPHLLVMLSYLHLYSLCIMHMLIIFFWSSFQYSNELKTSRKNISLSFWSTHIIWCFKGWAFSNFYYGSDILVFWHTDCTWFLIAMAGW
jgi:hypothetical protein